MANLLIIPRDSGSYKDGDILCAFSRRRISHEHCFLQCFKRDPATRRIAALNTNGLVPDTDVLWTYHEQYHEFKFEKLSDTEGRITRQSDGQTIRFVDSEPFTGFNGREQVMHMSMYISRRRATLEKPNAQGKCIFETAAGNIVWFGGRTDLANPAKLATVWHAVETARQVSRNDAAFQHFPLGRQDVRSFLPMATRDFTDAQAATLVESDMDVTDPENPVMVQKRKHSVAWRDRLADLGVTEADVLNRTRPIDRRVAMPKRAYTLLARTKARPVV